MIVKKFEGATVEEVQEQIASQMGPNAVILTSRKKDYTGFKALFFKNSVQVVAAIDDGDYKHFQRAQTNDEKEEPIGEDFLETELKGFKERLFNAVFGEANEKGLSQVENFLLSKGLESQVTNVLLSNFQKKWAGSSLVFQGPFREKVLQSLERALAESIQIKPTTFSKGKGELFAFFGPRGSEKEEVIAKFACHLKEEHKLHVGVIGWQMGQRLGEKEALLAAISSCGAPISFVKNTIEWDRARKEFERMDVLLIDTEGNEFFPGMEKVTSIFVANSLWKTESVVETFTPKIAFDSMIVTEVSSFASLASVVNFSFALNLPLSYLLCKGSFFQANQEDLASSLISSDALPSHEKALF